MGDILVVKDLVKDYPGGVRAVDGISFSVAEGEIFGFLGPNGAGKTTTIRVIVALLARTSGKVLVDGFDPARQPNEVRQRIGYAAQAAALDDDLTGIENLVLVGRLHGLPSRDAKRRAVELIELVDLADAANRRAGTYSGGMRRRLDLAGALVHKPPLLVLDEPTTGLDPQNRLALWQHLEGLRNDGATLFLTTQYLEETDRLADRVAIIDHGRIVALGAPEALKADIGADVIQVTLPSVEDEPGLIAEVERTLADFPGLTELRHEAQSVSVYVKNGAQAIPEVVRRLDAAGIEVKGLTLSTPTLDDVFLRHTGSRMRVEEVTPPSRTPGRRRRRP
ncbi:MAG: ATP-binding cassette domain-containing protein [Actinomycetota bacterium]